MNALYLVYLPLLKSSSLWISICSCTLHSWTLDIRGPRCPSSSRMLCSAHPLLLHRFEILAIGLDSLDSSKLGNEPFTTTTLGSDPVLLVGTHPLQQEFVNSSALPPLSNHSFHFPDLCITLVVFITLFAFITIPTAVLLN
jgi:hypothetical protein